MDYLTKYYKNLSEQLQEKVNYYTKLIETYSTIMPDPEGRYPGRKPRNPSHWDEPTEEPDMSDWKYPHPMPRPSDSGVWEDGGGKFPSPKPYPYPGGGKEKMPPVKPPFIGKEKVPPTKPPFGKEKKPIKGELFDREHLMGESTSMSENLGDKIMKSFLKFLNEESESNKRELERINQDRKDEGKPPFKTLDQALTYYEKEDEKARRKKLRENREVSKAGDYDDSDLPPKGPKNFEIIDKIDGSIAE